MRPINSIAWRELVRLALSILTCAILFATAASFVLFALSAPPRAGSEATAQAQDHRPAREGQTPTTKAAEVQVAQAAKPDVGWGHLKGRFLIAGAPTPAKVDVKKDVAFCGKFGIVDESLIVAKDGGLKNVLVTLWIKTGDAPPKPHDSYAKTADAKVLLDNKDCMFVPRVALLRTTQTLVIRNSDPASPLAISHNANIASAHNPINPNLVPGESIERQFKKTERMPASVSCASHTWMQGWLVIKDTSYMAVTDTQGNFTIENLPAGTWTFHFWQEKLGYVDDVRVGGAVKKWTQGRTDIEIKGGQTTDLGTVQLKFADYAK